MKRIDGSPFNESLAKVPERAAVSLASPVQSDLVSRYSEEPQQGCFCLWRLSE
jgi:hypothetical protein